MDFYPAPKGFVETGETLPYRLYIRISDVKAVLLFEKDTQISDEELNRINSYPEDAVLFDENGYNHNLKKQAEKMSLGDGKIDAECAKEVAKGVLNPDSKKSSKEQFESIINDSTTVVKTLLGGDASIDGAKLLSMVQNLENNENILLGHAHKVCMVGMTLAMTQQNIILDFLNDIGLSSMFHGGGLFLLARPDEPSIFDGYLNRLNAPFVGQTKPEVIQLVITKHMYGHMDLTPSEEVIFLKHLTLVEKCFDPKKYKVSNIVRKIIGDFKILQSSPEERGEKNVHIASKILFIADRLVGLLDNPDADIDLKVAIQMLKTNNMKSKGKQLFDQAMLDRLDSLVL